MNTDMGVGEERKPQMNTDEHGYGKKKKARGWRFPSFYLCLSVFICGCSVQTVVAAPMMSEKWKPLKDQE